MVASAARWRVPYPRVRSGMWMRPPRSADPGLKQACRDGLVGSVLRDEHPGRQVDEHGGPADERQHGEQDADDGAVPAEVPADPRAPPPPHPPPPPTADRPVR